ncbi:transporter substrate-binding domain-containing protein [Oceanobacter sp. 5_MG-2023]|uniref:substrate-binding periplasmic protein n=1 Tax=Oceanobacter sp. 5_MG-2023 TaxID=3062645 RepID=UPI0026E15E4A|nr:transporter substrate-binding domain-containing protein [Oceanobacter sp. 5_MG-2023]MDO6682022.1 transporter substrate-binding domain-containing protein [Oceanobacter sp. 5_MG-2023]
MIGQNRMGIVAGIILSVFSCVAPAAEKITLLTEQYPPYNMSMTMQGYAHKSEDIGGLCTDIIRATFAKAGIEYRMKLRNWSYGMDRVQRRVNHGLFCTVRTEERESVFKWVGPITTMKVALMAKEDSGIKLNRLSDARRYTIGGYKGDAFTGQMVSEGMNVSIASDDMANPLRLQNGSIDLWVTDVLAGPYKASEAGDLDELKIALELKSSPVYLAFNTETDDEILQSLQNALGSLKEDGTITALEHQYGL